MSQSQAFEVIGGNRLSGDLIPQGAKNEALQILSAVLLTTDVVEVSNVPDIIDLRMLIELLRSLGVKVNQLGKGHYTFQADAIEQENFVSENFQANSRKIRGSVMLIGPLLARFRKAYLPKPGGDKIGRRRLDTHFNAFEGLGAEFVYDEPTDQYYLEAKNGLHGAYVLMDEISVTGTANILMAAVLASGTTTIYNAACEPYLQQLCRLLTAMGANIEGQGSNLLIIHGVEKLNGATHRILPDMIEIGSFIGLAAMTQSAIRIRDCQIKELGIIPRIFERLGIEINIENDDLVIPAQDMYEIQTFMDGSIMNIYDSPWPGFTPDLMSIVLVVATQAKGSVLIHQKMFESRLFFVDKLIDMGAQIILCDPHRATVIGIERKYPLKGIEMTSPDIRAGVALLIAALSAQGKSMIYNINQIDRGYQDIDVRLNAIGAQIRRINV